MIDQILKDAIEQPRLFLWCGALDETKINEWIPPNRVQVPLDLRKLWSVTGGGEMFETETLLSPFASDPDYDINMRNEFYWKSGVDKTLLVFHIGTWISAIRDNTPHFISFKENEMENKMQFESIDAWYCQTLRKEYANRYDLKDLRW